MTEVASRRVLDRADEHFAATGTELRGFLSEEHGFLPRVPTPAQLPQSHRAWDEIAAALPRLWREVGVRAAVTDLPVLEATDDELPDSALRRAATILGMLAHAYVRCEFDPPGDLPQPLHRPWGQIAARLHRPEPFMQYEDIILGNWRRLDPDGPLVLENLDLLVAAMRTPTELIFYLTQIEMHARARPLVGAAVRAQEAVAARDRESLEQQLLTMLGVVRELHEAAFVKVDPNPYSRTHVDPVLWGALVAPFAVSLQPHIPGPGGTASPVFHVMDSLLGRRDFASLFGHEATRLREYGPAHLGEFVTALSQAPIREAVVDSGDRRLIGLLRSLIDAYAGRRGLLAGHRLKAYGYLEIAFKVGRPVTIGGVGGTFHDRPWRTVHVELESTREERSPQEPLTPHHATLERRAPTDDDAVEGVKHVVLDVSDRGIVYDAGDRCGILPENSDALVDRTLAALGASGDEPIPLTAPWREAVRYRRGREDAEALPLLDLLRYAKLRPLLRPVAKALVAVSDSAQLRAVVDARAEDQWELWDALELVAADGYDVTRLVRAQIWQDESLAGLVPPEPFRMYSISSAPDGVDRGLPAQLHLTVGSLEHRTGTGGPVPPATRRGTASTYVNEGAPAETDRVTVEIVHPLRFHLPADPATPIVMFAGGTGISPFRGFIEQRAAQADVGETWLFFSTRAVEHLYYRGELERHVASGVVQLQVAFSREDATLRFDPDVDGGRLVTQPGTRLRIDGLIEADTNAAMLWDLLRTQDEGGRGGVAYICGQGGFAQTVLTSLYRIAERSVEGDAATRRQRAEAFVRQMMADRRLMLDVFTTFVPAMGPGVLGDAAYDASEVVLHNDDEHGYWMVIDGSVYDVTEFRHLHPGGRNIVDSSAGMDATEAYALVAHHENAEIDAMLSMYKIGVIRRLDFRGAWGIALSPEGLRYVSLHDAFRAWVRYLYLTVEMQNAFENDVQYLDRALTDGERGDELTPLKLMLLANTHRRFHELYYKGLLGADLSGLWAVTIGLAAPDEDAGWMAAELAGVESTTGAETSTAINSGLGTLYRAGRGTSDPTFWDRARDLRDGVLRADREFLEAVKQVLRDGVSRFETYEADTVAAAGDELVTILRRVPARAVELHRQLVTAWEASGLPSASDAVG